MKTVNDHSGYNFPWSMFALLPFEIESDYHDYHHSHSMDGNYTGNSCLWDWLFGDNDKYFEFVKERRQGMGEKRS